MLTLKQLIDKHFSGPLRHYQAKPSFSPSVLSGKCYRKVFYAYNKVPKDYDMPVRNKLICEHGNYLHSMLSNIFRKQKVLVDYYNEDGSFRKNRFTGETDFEFPLEDLDLEIKAKIDAVLILDGELWLGEYKSIKEEDFFKLKEPKIDHMQQATIYLYCLEKQLNEGNYKHIKEIAKFKEIKGIRFLYYNKNDTINKKENMILPVKEFAVGKDEPLFKDIIDKILTIKEYSIKKELPPKTFDFCPNCEYRKKCLQNKLG